MKTKETLIRISFVLMLQKAQGCCGEAKETTDGGSGHGLENRDESDGGGCIIPPDAKRNCSIYDAWTMNHCQTCGCDPKTKEPICSCTREDCYPTSIDNECNIPPDAAKNCSIYGSWTMDHCQTCGCDSKTKKPTCSCTREDCYPTSIGNGCNIPPDAAKNCSIYGIWTMNHCQTCGCDPKTNKPNCGCSREDCVTPPFNWDTIGVTTTMTDPPTTTKKECPPPPNAVNQCKNGKTWDNNCKKCECVTGFGPTCRCGWKKCNPESPFCDPKKCKITVPTDLCDFKPKDVESCKTKQSWVVDKCGNTCACDGSIPRCASCTRMDCDDK